MQVFLSHRETRSGGTSVQLHEKVGYFAQSGTLIVTGVGPQAESSKAKELVRQDSNKSRVSRRQAFFGKQQPKKKRVGDQDQRVGD